jgi:hypothetical protein
MGSPLWILIPANRFVNTVYHPHCMSEYFNAFFFTIKPTRCINSANLFCHETLHVSDSSSAYHQEIIHCTLSNGICHTEISQMGKNYWCVCVCVRIYIYVQCSFRFPPCIMMITFISRLMHKYTNLDVKIYVAALYSLMMGLMRPETCRRNF